MEVWSVDVEFGVGVKRRVSACPLSNSPLRDMSQTDALSSEYNLRLPAQGLVRPRRVLLPPFVPGSTGGSVLAYLGIPFAQPPVNGLRWKVPQGPLPTWQSVRSSQWASDPFQDFASMEGMYLGRTSAKSQIDRSEDCLYLNVWVPEASSERPRPVLCWIYGGAFSVGNCSRPLHDGARLALESGCIVVSLTYRVGAFGFLGSRAMASEGSGDWPLISRETFESKPRSNLQAPVGSGNWGLWDLVTGLLWIQHSIRHFNGDASNVTVFGESAGSIAIHYLLLSKVVPEGLFQKAILQSGVAATLVPRTAPSQQATFDFLVQRLCPTHVGKEETAQLNYLRSHVTAQQIADQLRPLVGKRPRSEYTPMPGDVDRLPPAREDVQLNTATSLTDQWGPVWDGVFVDPDFLERCLGPLPDKKDLRNGKSGVIVGLCADEGTMFNFFIASVEALADHQKLFHPSLSSDLQATYKFDRNKNALTANRKQKAALDKQAFATCALYTGDAQFTAPILDYLVKQTLHPKSQDGVDVYAYLLAHRPSRQLLEGLTVVPEMAADWATFHTLDIPFVFGLDGAGSPSLGSRAGASTHPWTSSPTGYGIDPDSATQSFVTEAPSTGGMTDDERQLSYTMMQTWSSFAHGSVDRTINVRDEIKWHPVSLTAPLNNVNDLSVLTFGTQAQATSAPSSKQGIPVAQMPLSKHPFCRDEPIPGTTLEERINFWMSEPMSASCGTESSPVPTRYLQNYYGYLHSWPTFVPW